MARDVPTSDAAAEAARTLGVFGQVGVVVVDLEETLRAHRELGPWSVWTYDRSTVPTLQAGGVPADFAFRIALPPTDPQLEFIEPLDDRSPYSEWLREHPPGIHHLGYVVDDVDGITRQMVAAGFDVVMSGSGYGADGSGAFCYYDTVDALGYVTEVIERPKRRRPPDAIYR